MGSGHIAPTERSSRASADARARRVYNLLAKAGAQPAWVAAECAPGDFTSPCGWSPSPDRHRPLSPAALENRQRAARLSPGARTLVLEQLTKGQAALDARLTHLAAACEAAVRRHSGAGGGAELSTSSPPHGQQQKGQTPKRLQQRVAVVPPSAARSAMGLEASLTGLPLHMDTPSTPPTVERPLGVLLAARAREQSSAAAPSAGGLQSPPHGKRLGTAARLQGHRSQRDVEHLESTPTPTRTHHIQHGGKAGAGTEAAGQETHLRPEARDRAPKPRQQHQRAEHTERWTVRRPHAASGGLPSPRSPTHPTEPQGVYRSSAAVARTTTAAARPSDNSRMAQGWVGSAAVPPPAGARRRLAFDSPTPFISPLGTAPAAAVPSTSGRGTAGAGLGSRHAVPSAPEATPSASVAPPSTPAPSVLARQPPSIAAVAGVRSTAAAATVAADVLAEAARAAAAGEMAVASAALGVLETLLGARTPQTSAAADSGWAGAVEPAGGSEQGERWRRLAWQEPVQLLPQGSVQKFADARDGRWTAGVAAQLSRPLLPYGMSGIGHRERLHVGMAELNSELYASWRSSVLVASSAV